MENEKAFIACKKLVAAVALLASVDREDEELLDWTIWIVNDLANAADKALNNR